MNTALEGIRILDLSRILAGPWCTQNLADLGADVIKVESPWGGDDSRDWGPHYLEVADGEERLSAYFLSCNRGKRSIAIDFSRPEGAEVVRRLARQADVVIENYKSGSLARHGLDYESLSDGNPGLIYVSITGFGQTGPMAGRPGYDYIFQGFGGLMSYTGHPDGEPGAGPLRTGASIIDLSTGMYATAAVLAALIERARTGSGRYVDLALSDVAIAINANHNLGYLISGRVPERMGNTHANLAPYEVFACADGHLILAIGNDQQFTRFCALAGEPGLASDARFASNEQRLRNRPALREAVAVLLARKTRSAWKEVLDGAGIPWGPINTLQQAFDDAQARHRLVRQTLRHPRAGDIPCVRNPLLAGDVSAGRAPPMLGEHTSEILSELRFDKARIDALKNAGIVAGD
ncbi:CaiB/BaiF CoA transferase family protein [Pseudomonas citronellolis]|uniref:CaiB/BaiF CoA transferase family protein n=1 Tax=Pseudomonas citronellolis TaxID=53408 RepID=UPI0009EA9EE5|nr:CaiB/BaiF CoA-transferase family protein [Pseudomonas citronellolis]WRT80497.1 CaiB/BaiF CoA-transferase family protein [Pseudomonas citronellolis]